MVTLVDINKFPSAQLHTNQMKADEQIDTRLK